MITIPLLILWSLLIVNEPNSHWIERAIEWLVKQIKRV